MPSDLIFHGDENPLVVRDVSGSQMPFSKGLLATSILATGLETDRAYRIAAGIQRELVSERIRQIDADDLAVMTLHHLAQEAGAEAAGRYAAWQKVRKLDRPFVIVISGAPGVGKSTITTRLAVRLGVRRIVMTDTIREVLRTVIPDTVLAELHTSTHESAAAFHPGDPPLGGFHRQAHAVGAATAAVATRVATERRNAIFEGVHMIPGRLTQQLARHEARPIVVEALLTLEDQDTHRAHLVNRSRSEPGRRGDRHLRNFDNIRVIQQSLREFAEEASVPQFDVAVSYDLTQHIVDAIVARAEDELPLRT